jgi:hypothetical protein
MESRKPVWKKSKGLGVPCCWDSRLVRTSRRCPRTSYVLDVQPPRGKGRLEILYEKPQNRKGY